ncbi:hypothetical protein Pint_24091 [Pistacia integerrima]|uniref:Uncharacterized protein n=1 Tax=Pistacia integerrima TaxID=434235 RepID=A0ACC0YIY0_9ROSI|nr:hypothetical protein Pint_24091 [Pistacia integerrima]
MREGLYASKLKPQSESIMGFQDSVVPCLIILIIAVLAKTQPIVAADHIQNQNPFNRSSFPKDFIFGTASAAYQYEGAAKKGGRGPSIWDTFTHKYPGIYFYVNGSSCCIAERITDGSNGDVAVDFYHRYKEDVQIMKEMNTDAFRFSISWSRILPRKIIIALHIILKVIRIRTMVRDSLDHWSGKLSGGVSKEGISFYNNLINQLQSTGLQPFVTIFHGDLPQALEDEYGGFLSPRIVDDFRDFAELCFKEFGDRVKHWITLNEPSMYSASGYDWGSGPPGRCSKWVNEACQAGNSSTEPYVVGHNLILSHAAAVKRYRQKFLAIQKGKIGITLTSSWLIPFSDSKPNVEAAKRALDFSFGWYMDPLVYGDYPFTMRTLVGQRLPEFTKEQSKTIKGSLDFIGLNYYTSNYAVNDPVANPVNFSYSKDSLVKYTPKRRGILIGPQAASSWLYVYPKGLRDLLIYIKEHYNNPLVYITENGISEFNNATLPLKEALNGFYEDKLLLPTSFVSPKSH